MLFRVAAITAVICGSTFAGTRSAPLSGCDAIANSDVAQALGDSVSDRRAVIIGPDATLCSFVTGSGSRVMIVLRRSVEPDWTNSQSQRMTMAGSFRPAPGLGEQAFVYELRKGAVVVCVFFESFYFQVSVVQADSSSGALAPAEQLGRRILEQVKRPPASK